MATPPAASALGSRDAQLGTARSRLAQGEPCPGALYAPIVYSLPPWVAQGNVPSLNGLRAVSILLVTAGHLSMQSEGNLQWLPNASRGGVIMFFVISGFLITLLLEREFRRTQTISLKQFYLRRSLRILPAYICFLLAMFVFQTLHYTEIPLRGWITALTYTSSLVSGDNWDLGHTWSLSIEEHFYLVWPFCFLALGRRRAFLACVVCVAVSPLLRVLFHYYYFRAHGGVGVSMFTFGQMDCIAIGCGLAILATSARCRWFHWPTSRSCACLFFGAALLLAVSKVVSEEWVHLKPVGYYVLFVSPTTESFLIAILLWTCINNRGSLVFRLLNSRPLQLIGALSYGLYLWQQPLINPQRTGWIFTFPFNVCFVFLLAGFSYVLIELPFLNLKRRVSLVNPSPALPSL